MVLMVFCMVCFVDGVQICEYGYISCSNFDEVEMVIGFNLCDWWQFIVENFFGLFSKNQIVEVLQEVGLDLVVVEVVKLKKGDVVIFVECFLLDICWVSGWMQLWDMKKLGLIMMFDIDVDNEDNMVCVV